MPKPPEGPYPALSTDLCCCGYYHGSNLGKCLFCFNYYGDTQLANYLDRLVLNKYAERFIHHEAQRILERHGSCLTP